MFFPFKFSATNQLNVWVKCLTTEWRPGQITQGKLQEQILVFDGNNQAFPSFSWMSPGFSGWSKFHVHKTRFRQLFVFIIAVFGLQPKKEGSQPTNFYGRFISERSESAGKRSAQRLPKPPEDVEGGALMNQAQACSKVSQGDTPRETPAEEIPEPPSSPVEGQGHFSEWGTHSWVFWGIARCKTSWEDQVHQNSAKSRKSEVFAVSGTRHFQKPP